MSAVLAENKPRRPIVDPWQSASSNTIDTASTSTPRPRPAILDPWAQPAANEAAPAPQTRKPTPERSWGEAATDRVMGIGAAGLDAIASTVRTSNQRTPLDRIPGGATAFAGTEAVTGLASLARPILPDAVNRKVDDARAGLAAMRAADPQNLTPRSEFAASFADTAAGYASDARAQQSDKEKATQQRITAASEEGFWPVLKEVATNPSALATATDSLPSMLAAGGGAGGAARALATRAGTGAAAAGRIATGTQLGTMAALEGAGAGQGAYDAVMDAKQEVLDDDPAYLRVLQETGDPARAREALAQMARSASTGTGTAASLALMGLGERLGLNVVEDAMLGKTLRGVGSSRIGNTVAAGAREFAGEAAEGAANQLSQNVGAMLAGVEDDPLRGVGGAAALEGAVGALAGGVRGMATTPDEAGQQRTQAEPDASQSELLALPPPGADPIVVTPDGTAYTAQQRETLGLTPDILAAQRRRQQSQTAGNTAPFPDATPSTLADAANTIPQAQPVLADGSPIPDPATGPLSRVVNQGVVSGGIPTGPRTWEQMQANIALDAEQARAGARREREIDTIARESRLPAALFDAERDAALREASGQNAIESAPSAMQLAMQRAQRERRPINDPWASDVQSADLRFASESRASALPRSENAAVEATQGFDVSNAETLAPAVRFEPKGEKGLLVHGDHAANRERLAAAGFRKKGRNQDGALRFDAKDRPALEAALSMKWENPTSFATPANTAPATGTRPPIRDPWASPDPDLGEQYARGRVREGTSMGIPIDPATGRPESTPKGGISNPPPAIAPLAAPIIPPWSNPAKGETTTPTPALIRTAVEQQVAAQYQHNGKTALNTPMLSRAWGVPQKDIARITREVRASFAPASATATATHTEPGQPPQPATPSVVAESAQTVARAPNVTMAQAKGNVLSQIDAALELANTDAWPDIDAAARQGRRQAAENERDRITQAAGFVTFDVPGDGTFRVVNNRSRLEAFRTQVERQFKNPQPPRGPQLPRIGMSEAERTRIMAEAEPLDVNEVAQFSRTGTTEDRPAGPGLPVANVQRIVNDFQRHYRGNIPLQVRVGATVNDLYGVGADQLESLRSFKGAYHPRRGIVALAADRLSSRADVEATLRHEVLGHYGLNTFAPADKQAILEAILSSRTEPSLTQLWAQTDALYADMPDLVRAEEVFAELAGRERGTLGQWWDRVLVLLAKALRNVGLLRGGTSRAELHDLARRIGEGIRSGERTQQTFPASDQEQFSRADPIGSPAFRHWFGDSQVTDANGAPRVVYHGTASDFWAFDAARLGENTGHLTAPLGFFFTENRAEAQRYAEKASEGVPADERLIDVYLSIQNPKAMTLEQFHAIDSFDQARAVREQLQRQGHDGIRLTSNGRSQWIAFVPTQAKSASQNRGSFNPADPDMRFSRAAAVPSDPFAEENRRLREQDKSIWKKAGQILRREFAPGGLLPEQVFGEKIARDSNFQAVEFDVRHLAGTLEKAVRQDFGKALDRLPEAKQRQLGEALAGKVPDTLPPETRAALVAMRQYIDALSGEYLGIIQNRIDTLAEHAASTGRDADAARALDEIGLYEKIKANIGQYVHRSYRAFDDPQWFKKVPTEVLNAARRYLGDGYLEQGSSPAEARRLADVAINEILKNGTAYDSMEAFIAEGKLGAKDLSVLMRRKDVPPEIRALLGEYTDPRVNFAKSATKMGRLIWNQRFLDRVRDIGMGSFLFEGRNRPASATAQLAAEGSDTLAPLNGLWTFPEVAQAFTDALGKEQMGALYRAIVRMNGMVKYGKTVLSPTTAMRNWQSAMFFSLANGHFDLREAKKGWIAFREQVAQNAKGDQLAYLRRLKELGVVYDAPYAGEMARYIQDARLEELLEGKSGKALHLLRKMNQTAQGFYSFGDDFWKIIGFENEKAALVKAGITPAQAEAMAAERIRNTYPTYSMVGRGVKWLSRFPLVGTFVSFPAEIVRTSANMLQLTAADLRSDKAGIRAIGRKRAAGLALVSAGFYALSALTKAMVGVGDDEEEALRDLAPPWQKNSTFLYTGRDAKGQLRYFDMSFLDPYGYWKRPITAMMRNQPWEDAAASAVGDMLSPFLGTDISAGAIFEVMANKKGSGGRVYSPNGDPLDQTTDIANHLRKALQPGFVGNAERLVLAAKGTRREGSGQPYDMRDEVVSLLGWRASTLDTKTALYYRSFEFTDALTSARQELTRTLRSSNPVSRQDIQRSRAEAERQYGDAFRQMHRLVASARAAGMTRPQIARTLRLSGVSAENTQALIAGRTPPMRIGAQSARNAVQQARTMQGPAQAREVAQRFREVGAR